MFGPKIKLDRELYDRLKQCAEIAGYSSTEEFIRHTLENAVSTIEEADSEEEVKKQAERLDHYIDNGAEYVIIDPEKLGKFLTGVNYERFPMVGDFYQDVLESPRLEPIKRLEPADRLGPTLQIYRVIRGP